VRILIVEDNEDSALMLCAYLRSYGYAVERAGSAAEGYRACVAAEFDLLILDIVLPDEDGWDLLARLRLRGCVAPALALTGLDRYEVQQQCAAAGFVQCLQKPLDLPDLLVVIQRHLAGGIAPSLAIVPS
jgi:DNA-binding response OmpR family regulator